MVSYKDAINKSSDKNIFQNDPFPDNNSDTTITTQPNRISKRKHNSHIHEIREHITKDYVKEHFIEHNLDLFINFHNELVDDYELFGFLNKSTSYNLIYTIIDSLIINNTSTVSTQQQYNSDDDN